MSDEGSLNGEVIDEALVNSWVVDVPYVNPADPDGPEGPLGPPEPTESESLTRETGAAMNSPDDTPPVPDPEPEPEPQPDR